jgi:hypothetical protein
VIPILHSQTTLISLGRDGRIHEYDFPSATIFPEQRGPVWRREDVEQGQQVRDGQSVVSHFDGNGEMQRRERRAINEDTVIHRMAGVRHFDPNMTEIPRSQIINMADIHPHEMVVAMNRHGMVTDYLESGDVPPRPAEAARRPRELQFIEYRDPRDSHGGS